VGRKGIGLSGMSVADAANLHTFVDAVRFIGDHPGFLAQKALEQLELSGAALGIAAAIALPLGVVLGHFHRGSSLAIGTSIIGRALPSLVRIAAFLTVLGIGFVNNMVALAVLGTGPILTSSYDGIDRVDKDIVESARGMGMTGWQIMRRIELPLGIPLLFTGIRISAVTIVATAPIAAIAGGGGLGDVIVNQASYRLSGVLGASLCVMALSALVFAVLAGIQIGVTPRGLRRTSVIDDHSRKEQQ
jgi:osmoprotectant transport system permease protein